MRNHFGVCFSVDISNTHLFTARFGYVEYNTHEEAKEAVTKKVEVFGRWLNLDMADSSPSHGMNL